MKPLPSTALGDRETDQIAQGPGVKSDNSAFHLFKYVEIGSWTWGHSHLQPIKCADDIRKQSSVSSFAIFRSFRSMAGSVPLCLLKVHRLNKRPFGIMTLILKKRVCIVFLLHMWVTAHWKGLDPGNIHLAGVTKSSLSSLSHPFPSGPYLPSSAFPMIQNSQLAREQCKTGNALKRDHGSLRYLVTFPGAHS